LTYRAGNSRATPQNHQADFNSATMKQFDASGIVGLGRARIAMPGNPLQQSAAIISF